jgi:hypothetical protein
VRTAPSDQAVRDALTALCPDPAPLALLPQLELKKSVSY